MAKVAHITSKPGVEVGDKALALCGKDFKVKVLWTDVPTEKPICRECVDVALDAMTEADALVDRARLHVVLVERRLASLVDTLNPADLFLDVIAENQSEYDEGRRVKQEAKAAKKRAKTTCTCEWGTVEAGYREEGDATITSVDPDCPIHGGQDPDVEVLDEVPVAPEEEQG